MDGIPIGLLAIKMLNMCSEFYKPSRQCYWCHGDGSVQAAETMLCEIKMWLRHFTGLGKFYTYFML